MQRRSLHPVWGNLRLHRGSQVPLREQIVAFYRSAIREGRLPGGMQVRSSREFASEHRISRTTAVQAYEKLVEEGYLVSRRGAGVFVATILPEAFTLRAVASPSARPRRSEHSFHRAPKRAAERDLRAAERCDQGEDPPDLSTVDGRRYELPLSPGMPALDKFPWNAWSRISNQVFHDRPLNVLGYGDPQGELPLRESVAQYLAESRGIVCTPGQIVITSGTEQTIEFLAGQLAEPGDEVWFEDPSYPFVRRVLRAAGLDARPVTVDEAGVCVADGLASARNARVAIVSPTHQYPLGVTMSLARRQELIDWSRHGGSWIIENEIDGDYRFTPNPIPPVFALSDTGRVIYCGSLSKLLAPGLRVNYFVAPAQAIRSFVLRSTLVPMFTQLVLARFDAEGYLASHMNKMRRLYARRRALLLDNLRTQARELLDVERVPEAGLRITAGLKTRSDDAHIATECLKCGVLVNPLSVCYDREPGRAGLIIGFASTPEERLAAAVHKLVGVISG
jgi:GntR family transcriptional regulator/MocR family aminotransferase